MGGLGKLGVTGMWHWGLTGMGHGVLGEAGMCHWCPWAVPLSLVPLCPWCHPCPSHLSPIPSIPPVPILSLVSPLSMSPCPAYPVPGVSVSLSPIPSVPLVSVPRGPLPSGAGVGSTGWDLLPVCAAPAGGRGAQPGPPSLPAPPAGRAGPPAHSEWHHGVPMFPVSPWLHDPRVPMASAPCPPAQLGDKATGGTTTSPCTVPMSSHVAGLSLWCPQCVSMSPWSPSNLSPCSHGPTVFPQVVLSPCCPYTVLNVPRMWRSPRPCYPHAVPMSM